MVDLRKLLPEGETAASLALNIGYHPNYLDAVLRGQRKAGPKLIKAIGAFEVGSGSEPTISAALEKAR
jgi:hypothetical protein